MNAIDRCLEKDRENRFANVAELTHELVPFTPERARAAISLIERVMTAGVQQPPALMPDAEFAAVIPSGEVTTVSTRQPLGASMTTLGTAASSISVGDRLSSSRGRWIVVAAIGIAAILIITIIAMPRSVLPSPTVPPVSAVVVSDEVHMVPDAAIDGLPDAPIDIVPDAPIDVVPDAPTGTSPNVGPTPHITPRIRSRTTPHKIAADASVGATPPEGHFLEPAWTDDVPVSSAR